MPTTSDSSRQAGYVRLTASPLPICRLLLPAMALLAGISVHAQSLREAEALAAKGMLLESIEQYDQFIARNPRRTYDHSVAWMGISSNYLQLGDYDAALQANQRSKTIREQLPVDDVAENYMRTGAIYLQLGAYELALIHLRQAKSLPAVEPYWFALIEGYMAAAYAGLRNYTEAELHFQLSIESLVVESGEFSPDVVNMLYQLALMYQKQGRANEAKENYLRALRIEETLPEHAGRMGLLLDGLGETILPEARHTAARSYFLRARAALHPQKSTHHLSLARIALHLSKAALTEGDRGAAAAEIMEAQRLLFPGLASIDFLQNPDPDRPCLDRLLAAETFLQKVRCLPGNIPATDAMPYYSSAFRLLEIEALAYPSEDRRLRAQDLLFTLADEALHAAFQSDNAAFRQMAFTWVDRAKAIQLHLQTAVPVFRPGSRESRLFQQWKQSQYQLIQKPDDTAMVNRVEEARSAYFESIGKNNEDAALLRPSLALEAIQALLDDATALIAYHIGAKEYYIFALSRNTFKATALAHHLHTTRSMPAAQPSEAASALRKSIADFLDALQNASAGDLASLSSELYTQLLLPASLAMNGKKNLIIIPHGPLAQLPFEALLTAPVGNADKKSCHQWPYLVKQYTVQYHLTANMWSATGKTATGTSAYTGWAPVFDTPETRYALADALYQISLTTAPLSVYGVPELPQIPESATEVQTAAQTWNRLSGGTQLFLRQEATESSVRSTAGASKTAHFATPAFSHIAHPRWSGLLLAPSGDDDGILYLAEMQLLHWNGALCILAGGNIYADQKVGREVLPAAYATLRAGAGGVAATLWNEHDPDRSRLLNDFFRKRATGMPTPEALRQSKLSFIKDKTTAAPGKWSGIIYFGK